MWVAPVRQDWSYDPNAGLAGSDPASQWQSYAAACVPKPACGCAHPAHAVRCRLFFDQLGFEYELPELLQRRFELAHGPPPAACHATCLPGLPERSRRGKLCSGWRLPVGRPRHRARSLQSGALMATPVDARVGNWRAPPIHRIPGNPRQRQSTVEKPSESRNLLCPAHLTGDQNTERMAPSKMSWETRTDRLWACSGNWRLPPIQR